MPRTMRIIAQTMEETYREPMMQIIPRIIVSIANATPLRKPIGEKTRKAEPSNPSRPKITIIIPPINARMYPTYAKVAISLFTSKQLE